MLRRFAARLWYRGAVLNRVTGWRLSRVNAWIYRLTRGRLGGWVPGAHVILLTTTGRRSGRHVTVPVSVLHDGDDLIVGAGAGGSPTHPQWYRNLAADPTALVQLKGERFQVEAEALEGSERERIVRDLIIPRPLFDIQYRRTGRSIPLLRLRRI